MRTAECRNEKGDLRMPPIASGMKYQMRLRRAMKMWTAVAIPKRQMKIRAATFEGM